MQSIRLSFVRMILFMMLFCFFFLPGSSLSEPAETKIEPAWPVPDYVQYLLQVAGEEVGYQEREHGWTKYGEWAGDPYCQWCAEFQCWCVNQVDLRYGTALLNQVYPKYSSSNIGRAWFIKAGRYVIRKGPVEDWGYEWLKGRSAFLQSGDYIPQPGDWVFFTWTSDQDTDHVALVEYCTMSEDGNIFIHVIEGNKPSSVARDVYDLNYSRILGYGTVHDVADITMSFGNQGVKVLQLQEKLSYLGYLELQYLNSTFGKATADAVKAFQTNHGIRPSGIANIQTQLLMDQEVELKRDNDPETWLVIDDE